MQRIVLFALFSTLFATILSHPASAEFPQKRINRVIYVTLDGVRWQDVYLDRSHFAKIWTLYAPRLSFYGEPGSHTTMSAASIPVSLPSYQSQMSGSVQPCTDNECGRIRVQTLPEYLINRLHFAKQDVAIFSSWPEVAYAAESKPGTAYCNAGNLPVTDPVSHRPDEVMAALNHQQDLDHPGYKPNRYDKYTFAQALHYLEKYHPRFLWISLVNADDEAHFQNLQHYHRMLSYYDDALNGLFKTLKSMRLDDSTMVIVTTDHGRGNNENWTTHGKDYPESSRTWAFVMNGKLAPTKRERDTDHYDTLSIRPAIEQVFS
ncbi:hypothetical protein AQUSIP_14530 [Aquicella siphonis]|uniref:Sulfatase N-terminal domain-containing protein n=1 Tax=Aquicella siphonis TaxID=254247 RepID=A0A5E4PHZ2_9COXI|nr:sulfatase-like hydrolase/transferase [Aquicella siphonis]VVC76148.1 hypothetical protein AQUSIP_14530 [Aquicella siphonis]